MLALLRRASFWTTFCGLYFNHHYTHIYKLHFFHDLDHLWAASMYWIYTCLSDLWVLSHVFAVLLLFLCGLESHMFHFQWFSSLLTLLKNHHPCCFSLHLSSLTCCVWTVVIRGSGVDHLIGFLLRTTSCCWMPPWLLYLLTPLVLVAVHLKIFHLLFWSYFTPQYAQWLYYTPFVPMRALLLDPSCVLLTVGKILTRHVGCVQLCHRHIHIKLEASSGRQFFW